MSIDMQDFGMQFASLWSVDTCGVRTIFIKNINFWNISNVNKIDRQSFNDSKIIFFIFQTLPTKLINQLII